MTISSWHMAFAWRTWRCWDIQWNWTKLPVLAISFSRIRIYNDAQNFCLTPTQWATACGSSGSSGPIWDFQETYVWFESHNTESSILWTRKIEHRRTQQCLRVERSFNCSTMPQSVLTIDDHRSWALTVRLRSKSQDSCVIQTTQQVSSEQHRRKHGAPFTLTSSNFRSVEARSQW